MANPALETFRARGMVLKKETVEGTDAAPTSALNAFQILDGKSSIQADAVPRNIDRPFFNGRRTKYANFRASIEGSIELVPPAAPGVDDASAGLALEIAGMAKTLTEPDPVGPPIVLGSTLYNPISKAIPSATAWWWHAGTLRKILGARGNLTGLNMEIGKYLMAQLRIEGSCAAVTEAALPTDFDYDAFLVPTVGSTESMELTIDAFAVNGKMLSVDFGNQLKTVQHTEARIARIGDKQSTFKARFYRTLLADFDPFAKWRSGDIITCVGTTIEADNRYTRMTTLGEITGVAEVDIDNDYGFEISGTLVASDSGNDEVLVDFGEG